MDKFMQRYNWNYRGTGNDAISEHFLCAQNIATPYILY